MNTFLVMSPLQLINAAEARAHFRTENNTLIVLRNTTQGFPLSMFKKFIDKREWDRIYFLATYHDERITTLGKAHWFYLRQRQRRHLVKLAATLGFNENLFVGNYNDPLTYYFSRALPHKKLYLVDDGTSTLEVNDARVKLAHERLPRLNFVTREYASRAADNWAQALVFFSAYAFEPRPSDTHIPNRYEHFRKSIVAATASDEVWFLGGPLATSGYLTEATYLRYLEQIRHYYRHKTFVYLPHSREPEESVAAIGRALGCEVRRYGLPVELALAQANPRPHEVATLISSALTNCHIMFGRTLQLTAFFVEPGHLTGWHALVASIYEHFRKEADAGFRVLELETEKVTA